VKELWHHWVQKPKTNRPAIPTVGCFTKKLSAPLRLAFTAVSRINTTMQPQHRASGRVFGFTPFGERDLIKACCISPFVTPPFMGLE